MEIVEFVICEYVVFVFVVVECNVLFDFIFILLYNFGSMCVIKCNGGQESVDVNKIVKVVICSVDGLYVVDLLCVVLKIIGGLYDGVIIVELDQLLICIVVVFIVEEFEYGQFVVCLFGVFIDKEVSGQDIQSFLQLIVFGVSLGIFNDCLCDFVVVNVCKFNDVIDLLVMCCFEYFGLCMVYDCYLLCYFIKCYVIEMLQYFFMCIVCVLGGNDIVEMLELYWLLLLLEYIVSLFMLFNVGIMYEQLFLCFLFDLLVDLFELIYDKYVDVVKFLKFVGGIGLVYLWVCLCGLLIKGINGYFNGLVLWLKMLDVLVVVVNQGGKCKGVVCVYLELWYVDIEEFFELCDNIGDEVCCMYNFNLVNWIFDEFMCWVEVDGEWLLFDLKVVLYFVDSWGESFEVVYCVVEVVGFVVKMVKVCEFYVCMLCMFVQIGNGWMIFKDCCNVISNQMVKFENVIYLFNLCIEIFEVILVSEMVVCNFGLINLVWYVVQSVDGSIVFDFDQFVVIVCIVVCQFDWVIDFNFYLIDIVVVVNCKWWLVGLGVMGLQDVFFKLCLLFDLVEVLVLFMCIVEEIYFYVLSQLNELVVDFGMYLGFVESCVVNGELQFDYWLNVMLYEFLCWEMLCVIIQ